MAVRRAMVGALAICMMTSWFASAAYAHGQPFGGCGPDQSAAVSSARKHVPHDQFTQGPYDPVPIAGNYDPCADLSTVLLTSDRSRTDAPVQAFLFHRGTFVGAAFESRPYTNLNEATSSKDVVALDFVTAPTCPDCDDGRTQTVRYVWTGASVTTIDRQPQTHSLP